MKHQSKFLLWLLTVLCMSSIQAQETNAQWIEGVSISLFNEKVTTPFEATDAIQTHWGGTVAYETSKKRSGIYQFTHIFQGGYYYHANFNQVAFLAWKPKFELRFNNLFNLHAILGVGYAHSFLTQPRYQIENGQYQEKRNWGTPHFMPSLGIGTGVNLNTLLGVPLEVFVRYEAFSLAPYKPKGRLPFTPNTMFGIGLTYSFN